MIIKAALIFGKLEKIFATNGQCHRGSKLTTGVNDTGSKMPPVSLALVVINDINITLN
jgi:hypothetical protein